MNIHDGDILVADLDKENQKLIFTLKNNSSKSKSEKSEA
jgi:ATP-dependent Clp protease ATP-binding subunit ClpC